MSQTRTRVPSFPSSPRSSASSASLGLAICLVVTLGAFGLGCSSTAPVTVDGGVGIVTGALDDHCSGVTPILVSQAACTDRDAGAAAEGDDGGASDDGGAEPAAPVLYNAEADDDDCKYHVKFSSTPVLKNQNVTFDVTVTKLAENNAPATNADVVIESFLADNEFHPVPNSGQKATEGPAGSGKYMVGPVRFDASGRWVVKFHFYETCFDLVEASPHGHVAFYYDVP
jgi:hypothetical protein